MEMIMNRMYRAKWNGCERNSIPRRMELLNRINTNRYRESPLSLIKLTRSVAQYSTICIWLKDFIEQGYITQKERRMYTIEYDLTKKGEHYLKYYLNKKMNME